MGGRPIAAMSGDRRSITRLRRRATAAWESVASASRRPLLSLRAGPGLCYTLGQREILRWRLAAAEVAYPRFTIPNFHDRLLALGLLPLPTIDRELTAAFHAPDEEYDSP